MCANIPGSKIFRETFTAKVDITLG